MCAPPQVLSPTLPISLSSPFTDQLKAETWKSSYILPFPSPCSPSRLLHSRERSVGATSENDLELVHFSPWFCPCSLSTCALFMEKISYWGIHVVPSSLGSRSQAEWCPPWLLDVMVSPPLFIVHILFCLILLLYTYHFFFKLSVCPTKFSAPWR